MLIYPFSKKTIQYFLYGILLTPLIYFPWIWRPAQISKTLFFVFFVFVALLVFVSLFKLNKFILNFRNPILLSFGLYLFIVVITSVFGFDVVNSFLGNDIRFGGIILLLSSWIASILYFAFFDKTSWRVAEKIFVYSAVVIACYGILEFLHIVPDLGMKWPRSSSLMGNPIYFASYIIFPLTIALKNIKIQDKWQKDNLVIVAILSIALLLTGTRGVFVGIVVSSLAFCFLYTRNKVGMKKSLLFLSSAFFILTCVFLLARLAIPTSSKYSRYFHFNDQSSSSRIEFWKMALKGVKDAPFLGNGFENYYVVSEKYYSAKLYENEGNFSDKPHNAYVEILTSSGIIGLFTHLLFIFLLFRGISQAKKQKNVSQFEGGVLEFGLFIYLIQNFFAFDTIGSCFAFSYFVGYVSYISNNNTQTHAQLIEDNEKKKRLVIIILSAAVFCVFFLKYLIPTYKYFTLLANADRETNDAVRFQLLSSLDERAFVYDRNPLGKMFHSNGKGIYNNNGATQISKDYIQAAITQYDLLLKIHPRRGEYWYQRADVGLMKAFINKVPIDENTKMAVKKSIEFTPTRTEPYLVKATELEIEGKISEAIKMLEDVQTKIPNSNKLFWTLSVLYGKNENYVKSAEYGYLAIIKGLRVFDVQSILEFINYFSQVGDFSKVIDLYRRVLALFPEKIEYYPNLAASYAANGQYKEAIETAQTYAKLKPSEQSAVEQFIRSLPVSPN